ncbi:MAG TPA: PLP-dependent aminotransferase family protein [Sphingomicrobium sp.]|nr:PLP-dependent aminotransferase family protein [Sphingomicrobium sp.]
MEPIFELPHRNRSDSNQPKAQAVYELLKSAILCGELSSGCRLPPTRTSGKRFGLSRSTMVSIYERLATEDLIEARRGSGTFVALRPDRVHPPDVLAEKPSPPSWLAESLGHKTRQWQNRAAHRQPGTDFELRPGRVDPKQFPFDRFRRSMAKALRQMERSPANYELEQLNQGDHRFRRAIADHATLMRALVCDPERILVTSGAQQALDLLARTLVVSGSTVVAIEDPCFGPLVEPFISAGARIHRIPVDREGMVVDLIPDDTKLVCVAPSSQFPLGITMSANRRHQLVALARDRNVLIIEDDYGGELRTGGSPLKTLYSHDPSNVFYIGTFSVSMFPSFRLGFVVSPEWAMLPLVRAKSHNDWQSSSVVQAAAAAFIIDGYLSAHIAKMRTIYKGRKLAVINAIDGSFGELLRPIPSAYGVHLAAVGNPTIDWQSVSSRAQHAGVQVFSLAQFYAQVPAPGLVFGVGVEPEERLRAAVERLASLI